MQSVARIDYVEECYGEKPVKWYQRKSYNLSEQAKKAIDDQLSQKKFLFQKTQSYIDISHQALSVLPEAAVNKLPQNKYTNKFKSSLIFIKALLNVVNPLLKFVNQSADSLKTLENVKNRITEIKRIETNLQEIEKNRGALKGTLEKEVKKVTAVLDRIRKEGYFFNQEVLDEMYEHLLNHYLDLASKNQENP